MSAAAALAQVDAEAIGRDAAALVRIPSVTGDERSALEALAAIARRLGLSADLRDHDLAALRAHPEHPGEEAPRTELWDLQVTLEGSVPGAPRLAFDGHVDVVPPGTGAWADGGPWSGALRDGFLHGRGSADMKGAVVAALHALAAARAVPHGEVVLLAVGSEEDGGLGTFAALGRDARFDACLIPEPTGFDVVCAQAGALTFEGEVHGVAAHAAQRLRGTSAIDRYLPVHAALAAHERALNERVEHELMAALELPYPLLVGRLEAGEWASSVPDRLRFAGRAPVRIGEDTAAARRAVERVVAQAAPPGGPPVQVTWPGGQFASGETPRDAPFAGLVRAAAAAELKRDVPFAGVPWGADLRLWTARGIPCVMVGPRGIERAHAVDERVAVEDLAATARIAVRVIAAIAGERAPVPA